MVEHVTAVSQHVFSSFASVQGLWEHVLPALPILYAFAAAGAAEARRAMAVAHGRQHSVMSPAEPESQANARHSWS